VRPLSAFVGRTFVSPVFDYAVIGGGLSLVVTAAVAAGQLPAGGPFAIPLLTLAFFTTLAHFASSTVRLYTKEGSFTRHPFLTGALPLLTLTALTMGVKHEEPFGRQLQALYLTWSPFHYAAQAYGLAVMYCYRAGCTLSVADKRWIRAACLLPFLRSFFGSSGSGLEWFVSPSTILLSPALHTGRAVLVAALDQASVLVPLIVFGALMRRSTPCPLISPLLVVANGLWWTLLVYRDAFAWATIFHGLQYLAITLIFHVRERLAQPDNRHGWLRHAAMFYGSCLLLGYALFQIWPYAYVAAGFGWAESVLLVTAVINIHHFIVDAYIWRLRKDPNYRVVTGGALAESPA
jgi:hypothetical protein